MPDRYTYPNSEVLRNKFSLVEQYALSRVENGLLELGLAGLEVHSPRDAGPRRCAWEDAGGGLRWCRPTRCIRDARR